MELLSIAGAEIYIGEFIEDRMVVSPADAVAEAISKSRP
jgi:hypothetical protein